MNNTLFTMFWI